MAAELTIGPIAYHWPAERKRDFYARIADEAPEEWLHPHLARPHGPLTSLHAAQREREHAQELIRRELESHTRPSPSLEPHVPRGLRARHLREHERIKEACDEPHMRGLGLF